MSYGVDEYTLTLYTYICSDTNAPCRRSSLTMSLRNGINIRIGANDLLFAAVTSVNSFGADVVHE